MNEAVVMQEALAQAGLAGLVTFGVCFVAGVVMVLVVAFMD